MKTIKFDKTWTLFLDRDGVINRRLPGRYVTHPDTFIYLPESLEAISKLNKIFGRIIIVTNQKGVGKGLMKQADLDLIHEKLRADLKAKEGEVDAILAATESVLTPDSLHKPNPGMAIRARHSFPEIDFKKSVIVGDSLSDMEFGFRLGMWTVLVAGKAEEREQAAKVRIDQRVQSLRDWSSDLSFSKKKKDSITD